MSTLSVIIVTLNRAQCVRHCLERLRSQSPLPDQVIVVDASPDGLTRDVVAEFAGVLYLRNEQGYGHMTHGRNLGLLHATGDVIAFIDDDAYVHSGWSREIVAPFADPSVGGVGGRALRNQPGEDRQGVDSIGRFTRWGDVLGNFAADPGKVIEVDHLIGCNMSWRRGVLAELGGLRDDYPGTEVREETDLAFRVRALGYRLLFNPAAVVDHVGAPQSKGQRFDLRYAYYAHRNHVVLLLRSFGPISPVFWRGVLGSCGRATADVTRRFAAAFARSFVFIAGLTAGLAAGVLLLARTGKRPVRRDALGRQISAHLGTAPRGGAKGVEKLSPAA